jgi:HAD superfamily hydrolase (TIGR01509 family)
MPRPLQAVVFDFDGLMFNTEHLYRLAGTEVLRRRGKVADEPLFQAMMGRPPVVSLGIMIEWYGLTDTADVLLAESYECLLVEIDRSVAPLPGLRELLDALEEAKIPKAIASSSGIQPIEHVLNRFEWLSRFDFILTSKEVARGKPDPEIYQLACRRLELSPEQVLVLEDSAAGCQAAVSAGTFAVAVPSEYSSHHDFPGAALIADTLADPRIRVALGI